MAFKKSGKVAVFLSIGIMIAAGGSALLSGCKEPDNPEPKTENVDKEKFHVYLCFGQSNMNGSNSLPNAGLTPAYTNWNNERFLVLAALDLTYGRAMNKWHTAYPPLVRDGSGLCPADGFGRYLVENIPDEEIKIGVAVVAVPAAALDGFDKVNYADYYAGQDQWMRDWVNDYGGSPYRRLVELGKLAQETGVIKGILLHQGEGGGGKPTWGENVKRIYDNLLEDLNLEPDSVPLLAGQLHTNASYNQHFINGLPDISEQFHVISSNGLASASNSWPDDVHFSPAGMMTLGRRYGAKMYELLYEEEYGEPLTAAP